MHRCKTTLNFFLFISFIVTVLAPLTGVHVHKMASTLFLLLTIVHTIAYRRTLGAKKYLLLCTVVIAFASGLLGMIFEQIPGILLLHKAISIVSVFFLAIHIFVNLRCLLQKDVLHKMIRRPELPMRKAR